jgi:hypothetical protein
MLGKVRPVRRDWIVQTEPTALDLLPEGDGGKGFRAGEKGKEGIGSDLLAALRVGKAISQVKHESTIQGDGERRGWEQAQGTELDAELPFDLGQCV